VLRSRLVNGLRIIFRDVPRNLSVFSFVYAFATSLYWVISAPLLRLWGFTPLEYGVLGSVMGTSGLISTSISGWLTDRYGPKRIIYASLLLSIISNILFATGNYALIYLSAILSGLADPMTWISLDVLVSYVTRKERYHYAYPYLMSLSALGNAGGAYLGWIPKIISDSGLFPLIEAYRLFILIAAVLYIPCVMVLKSIEFTMAASMESKLSLRSVLGIPHGLVKIIAKLSIPEILIGFGAAISIHNISYYFMLKYNVGSGGLGTLFGTESLAMALLMLTLPKLREKIGGSLRTYVVLASTSIPLLIALTLIENYYLAIAIYIARTVLMNVASPLYTAFLMSIVPPEHRGKVSSILGIARRIAVIPGRSTGGYLLEVDLELPLRTTAILYALGLGLLAMWFRREESK